MLPNGTGTAIVTPFTPTGDVDHDELAHLVEWQIAEGVDFLVACGSTGEAALPTNMGLSSDMLMASSA